MQNAEAVWLENEKRAMESWWKSKGEKRRRNVERTRKGEEETKWKRKGDEKSKIDGGEREGERRKVGGRRRTFATKKELNPNEFELEEA